MRVLIAGGTGMIGTALTKSLLADGHSVCVLTRDPATAHLPKGATALRWDGRTPAGWGGELSRTDAVVNLVGERLSKWPWTKAQKTRFWDSRVDGGRALTDAIRSASPRPKVLIQASGVNYYGPHGLEPVTEADAAGGDFLANLCLAWEASTLPVEEMGLRRAIIRTAVVLSAQEGILPLMMLPVKLFAGGSLGGGKFGMPWIHLEDEVAAIRFLLENDRANGAFNLTSPVPTSSGDFLRAVARALHRPYWLPVPGFALRILLGEMSVLVLEGQFLHPQRLLELGFRFKFERDTDALKVLLEK
jgi:uncharacterized protein (TIGR01777 family)